TGQTLYITLNLNLWLCGQVFIDVPGTKVNPPSAGRFTMVATASIAELLITFDDGITGAETFWVAYLTDGLSPGINYVSTKYRSAYVQAADGFTSVDITAAWLALYPTPIPGRKVFCKIIVYDATCGNSSIEWSASSIIG
ncbi:MAG TPA: hypothetical protein VK566_02430, partial [Nitrososphaeraceae archaeon]|nr:hypothetical protein [Nitrososphaeraceae archaeon]